MANKEQIPDDGNAWIEKADCVRYIKEIYEQIPQEIKLEIETNLDQGNPESFFESEHFRKTISDKLSMDAFKGMLQKSFFEKDLFNENIRLINPDELNEEDKHKFIFLVTLMGQFVHNLKDKGFFKKTAPIIRRISRELQTKTTNAGLRIDEGKKDLSHQSNSSKLLHDFWAQKLNPFLVGITMIEVM